METMLDPKALHDLWTYLAATLASAGVACLWLGWRLRLARVQLDQRLTRVVAPALGITIPVQEREQAGRRTLERVVGVSARTMRNLLPDRQLEQMRANLSRAGFPYSRDLNRFLAFKALLALGIGVLAVLWQLNTGAPLAVILLSAAIGAALGFYLPGVWLGRRIAQQQQQLAKALPDALDLLCISVSAGLGFDGAILQVVQRWDNPLTEEFAAVLRDLQLGKSRHEALRDLVRRTGVADISGFVAAVIQADELGTPIREALQIQADQLRQRRRQRAEETARKATIKMLIPMALFIFPSMFVVLLGPAIPSLSVFMQ